MIRWKYVVPRFLVVAVVSGTLAWGTGPLLRWGLIRTVQTLSGAKAEVGQLNTSVYRGTVRLDAVAIADRDREFHNLIEFDRASLDVDMRAALRRKLVVYDGHIEGLRFNTQRESSGRLKEMPDEATAETSFVSSVLTGAAARGGAWFDQRFDNLQQQLENDLQSVKIGQDLAQRWPAAYRELEVRAERIEQQAKHLEARIKAISDNPLEHLAELQSLAHSVDQLRRDGLDARKHLGELSRQLQDDRRAVASAREHDEQYVRGRLHLDDLDGRSLTEYLLGQSWSKRIEMATRWLERSRAMVPAEPTRPRAERSSRGVTVIFPGFPSSPDVLVRQLQLSGDGSVDQKPFRFTGTLSNLSHQPSRHHEPATLVVRAGGAIELDAQVVLDRRAGEPIDRLVVDIPALRQSGTVLGDPAGFSVTVSPGTATIHADLALHGPRLSGHVVMRRDRAQLTPTMNPAHAGWLSPESLSEAFGEVDHLNTEVRLSGTLSAPRYEMRSNLGEQLAAGLNRALRQELARYEQQVIRRVHEDVERRLGDLQRDLVAKHGQILERLEIGDQQIGQLQQFVLAQLGSPESLLGRGRKLLFK